MSKPNIIYLMADQLRFDMLGAYGDQQCHTPTLDQLASRSTIFKHHFTPCPLSVPAYSSIMTGLYPHQHGAIINGGFKEEQKYSFINQKVKLLPNLLSDKGYVVEHVGAQQIKTHAGMKKQCPQTRFTGPTSPHEHLDALKKRGIIVPDMSYFYDPIVEYKNERPVVTGITSPRTAIFPLRENLYYDAVLAEKMADIITAHDQTKPLCLFGMFGLPHPPLWAPRRWATQVTPEQIKLPSTVGKWYAGMPAMQLTNICGQLGVHQTPDFWREIWGTYMGMISFLDHLIGQILNAAEKVGLLKNTVIIFTSDHGEMLGSHRLYQKYCMYEESIRVPMLLNLPSQTSSQHVSEMTSHIDLANTLLEIADAPLIEKSLGRSLLNIAKGQTNNQPREYTFASYDGCSGRACQHRMVRTNSHKLIHNIGDTPELYDIIQDPRETHNLIRKQEQEAIELDLRYAINRWMDQLSDPLPRMAIPV